jgi:hypothetical protein
VLRAVPIFAALCGCGFYDIPNNADFGLLDLGSNDLSSVDSTDPRIQVADLSTQDRTTTTIGPGPLGALPAGFCCNSNEDCRSRDCRSDGAGPRYCSDECRSDGQCTAWSASFLCDASSDRCVSAVTPYTCLPAEQYVYGQKPIGSCCASGFYRSGQECLGGLCEATGNDANPFYCTQGCDDMNPCPAKYICADHFCWIEQSFSDQNFIYTCQ